MTRGCVRSWQLIAATIALSTIGACSSNAESGPAALELEIERLADTAREQGYLRQTEALDDGQVTEAEYRQSIVDALECMERAGLAVSEITRTDTAFGFQLEAGFEGGTAFAGDAVAVADGCQQEHSGFVGVAWGRQTGETLTAAAKPLVLDCMATMGFDANDAENYADLVSVAGDNPQAVGACLNEAQLALNQP